MNSVHLCDGRGCEKLYSDKALETLPSISPPRLLLRCPLLGPKYSQKSVASMPPTAQAHGSVGALRWAPRLPSAPCRCSAHFQVALKLIKYANFPLLPRLGDKFPRFLFLHFSHEKCLLWSFQSLRFQKRQKNKTKQTKKPPPVFSSPCISETKNLNGLDYLLRTNEWEIKGNKCKSVPQ